MWATLRNRSSAVVGDHTLDPIVDAGGHPVEALAGATHLGVVCGSGRADLLMRRAPCAWAPFRRARSWDYAGR
jgi:hypothetical protein